MFGLEVKKRCFRNFVRAINASKSFDLPGTVFGVGPFTVQCFSTGQGRIVEDVAEVFRADDLLGQRADRVSAAPNDAALICSEAERR